MEALAFGARSWCVTKQGLEKGRGSHVQVELIVSRDIKEVELCGLWVWLTSAAVLTPPLEWWSPFSQKFRFLGVPWSSWVAFEVRVRSECFKHGSSGLCWWVAQPGKGCGEDGEGRWVGGERFLPRALRHSARALSYPREWEVGPHNLCPLGAVSFSLCPFCAL